MTTVLNSPDIQTLTEELIIQQAFPSDIHEEVKTIFEKIFIKAIHKTSQFFSVTIAGEELKIPYRIYYEEDLLSHLNSLTQIQQDIINCIYSRHSDGFVRQKCISKIIASNYSWVTPFIIRAVGEYVIE